MAPGKNVKNEIDAQKIMVSRLKEEIFGEDKSGASPYISEFLSEYGAYRSICTVEDVYVSAMRSDVVYFGDYHPLGASQRWAVSLISGMAARGADVVLAMEMLYTHQQEFLDRYMKETSSEEEFLRVIDYDSEWGFDWDNFKPLFVMARDPFVPIFGIDSPPRDQLRYIRERDVMMGRKIASIRNFFPRHKIVVLVGESHLASGHLPEKVKLACREAGCPPPAETVIVQNMDDIYWKLMQKGVEDTSAVEVGPGRYCVFTASPMLKYQSYRDMIEIWSDHSISQSALTSMEEMVENILILLGMKNGIIDDMFPELIRKKTYDAFAAFLRSKGVSEEGVLSAVEVLRDSGTVYFPGLNVFLMVRFDRACAAREAARFVVRALRGDAGPGARTDRGDPDRFYAYVIEEALSWTGGRLVDPPQNPLGHDDLSSSTDGRGTVVRPVPGLSLDRTEYLVGLLRYHRRREKKARLMMRGTTRLKAVFGLDIRERQLIIRALGRSLGNSLYNAYRAGKMSRAQLVSLFSERFDDPGSGARIYLEWLHRTGP